MIEKYVCIKKVSLENNEYYYNYFIVGNVYDFYESNGMYPYEHHNNNYEEFSFNLEELNYFFIKKSIIDREKIINKILKDD